MIVQELSGNLRSIRVHERISWRPRWIRSIRRLWCFGALPEGDGLVAPMDFFLGDSGQFRLLPIQLSPTWAVLGVNLMSFQSMPGRVRWVGILPARHAAQVVITWSGVLLESASRSPAFGPHVRFEQLVPEPLCQWMPQIIQCRAVRHFVSRTLGLRVGACCASGP